MKIKQLKQENKNLEKFSITKQEALRVEGGPELDRGTVTTPVEEDD